MDDLQQLPKKLGSLSIILYLIRLCLWFNCPVAEVMAQIPWGTCDCTSLPRGSNESDEWPLSDSLRRKHSGVGNLLEIPCPSSNAPSPSSVDPKVNKMCECSCVSRKVCLGGLIPGWGTGMGTGEAIKGQESGLHEDFGHLLASKENYASL